MKDTYINGLDDVNTIRKSYIRKRIAVYNYCISRCRSRSGHNRKNTK